MACASGHEKAMRACRTPSVPSVPVPSARNASLVQAVGTDAHAATRPRARTIRWPRTSFNLPQQLLDRGGVVGTLERNVISPLLNYGLDVDIAVHLGTAALPAAYLVASPHEVVSYARRNLGVVLVLRVLAHEVPHPGRRSHELSRGALRDKVEVCLEARKGDRVAFNVLQVGEAEWHQAGEVGGLPVDDLVHGHLFDGITRGVRGPPLQLEDVLRDHVLAEPEQ
mmetsp:Transcript_5615/g.12760  ORF Transcript_5615/g.12760 Transcript_5615/m.12760 type:complete len:225 (-) Transcript_5615:399-1073(-)